MSPRLLLALCALLAPLATSGDASANGRSPGTSTIHFRRGAEQEIAAGMSFGLLVSKDGGATWNWMCEEAIGYGGMYDPDYEYTPSGGLFATTYDGLKVTRDGCTFQASNGTKFASVIAQGSDGKLYSGASDSGSTGVPGDAKIYRSTNDGMTWTAGSMMPGMVGDYWISLEVAPSNSNRLYLSGYRFMAGQQTLLLFRSDDAGDTWQPLPTAPLAPMPLSTILIAGVSYSDPNLVFARVKQADNVNGDAIYRSTDAGATWSLVLTKTIPISLLVRRSGELVAGTQGDTPPNGSVRSTDNGATWIDLAGPPHINCLAENSAREVWACTQNYGGMAAPSDGYGIMKSTDLATWSPALKYQEMKAPIACAAGTVQKDRCDTQLWCGLCAQLGCVSGRPECAPAADTGTVGDDEGKGCCKNSATPAPGALLLVLAIGVLLLRPRPRRR
jgi:hypothetical protein